MKTFESSYYEDEVREGFFVPSIIKKAWAANLIVLSEVDRICKKYNITYYAAYGTILGAIRHGGFIPWDDDLDIMMKRSDYEKFLSVSQAELPEGYTILNSENTDNFWFFLARVATGKHMRFEEEYLEQMHGFPFITGLDIFILDSLSSDPEKEKKRDEIIDFILKVADSLAESEAIDDIIESGIKQVERICNVTVNRNQTTYRVRKDLYKIAIGLCSLFEDDKNGNIARLMPDIINLGKSGFPRHYFEKTVSMPFEDTTITVPAMYHYLMHDNYGRYINIVKGMAGHEYPFIEKQKVQFERVWGQKFPEYEYPLDLNSRQRLVSSKVFVKDYLDKIHNNISDGTEYELVGAQELAIEIGNYLDETRNDCEDIIRMLEQLCECLFVMHNCITTISTSEVESATAMDNLVVSYEAVEKMITERVLKKKEIIFIPFNEKYWEHMETAYKKEMCNPNNEVFVVPIPYFYKKYDGTMCDMVFDISAYPDELNILDYKTFDWENRHPDRVYIQYPYDVWNGETVIPKEYFSNKLWYYTDELVYIPYFKLADFTKEDEREYYNMKYYCTMPAVVNADRVLIQSASMKSVYIQKLVEFAGEETRSIWEKKIQIEELLVEGKTNKLPKAILYFVGFSHLYQYGDQMISKMKRVFETFKESNDKICIYMKVDPVLELNDILIDKKVLTQYTSLINEMETSGIVKVLHGTDYSDMEDLLRLCDAYYGNESYIAHMFSFARKPVMISNISI